MKPHNRLFTMDRVSRVNGVHYSTETIVTDVVSCPATNLHGNFKDANLWSYTVDRHRRHYGTCWVYNNPSDYVNEVWGDIIDGPVGSSDSAEVSVPPRLLRDHLYNAALSKCYEKIRGNLDLSIDIAEWKQTRRMFKGLANWERYVKKWSPRDWANKWLEQQYGWKPLIQTLYDVTTELRRKVSNETQTIKGAATQRYADFKSVRTYANLGPTELLTRCSGLEGCRMVLRYRPKANDLARWTSLNPISIAWELMPYSFVVDWFYDIGSTLRNFETALLYNQYVTGYVDELYVAVSKEDVDLKKRPAFQGYRYRSKGYRRKIDFNRSVLTSAPLPRKPQWKVSMGWQRWMSAWALSSQVLLGRKGDIPLGQEYRTYSR